MTTGRINQNATDTVTTPSEGLPEDNSEAPSPFKPTRHPAVTNQLRFNNSTNSVVCVLRFRAEDHYPPTVAKNRTCSGRAKAKERTRQPSLVTGGTGSHKHRRTEEAELVRYFTRCHRFMLPPDSRVLKCQKVPTQTSQRIANNAVSRSRSNREKLPRISTVRT